MTLFDPKTGHFYQKIKISRKPTCTQDLYFKNVSLADADQDFLRVLFVSDGEGVNKGFELNYAIYHDPPAPVKEIEVVEVDADDRVFVSDVSVSGGDEGSVGAQEGGKVNSAGSIVVSAVIVVASGLIW